MQGMHEGRPQKQRWWVLDKAKQGFRQLQKLNLAFQDWTERFWKASAAIALSADPGSLLDCTNAGYDAPL